MYLLTGWLTDWLADLLTCTCWLTNWLISWLTDWLADLLIKLQTHFFRNLPTNWLGDLLNYWLCMHPLPLSCEVTSKSFTFVWQIHVDWLTDSHVSSDWLIGSLLEWLALLVVWNNGEMENKYMNKARFHKIRVIWSWVTIEILIEISTRLECIF